MSNYDQLTQDNLVGAAQNVETASSKNVLNDISDLENCLPKDLSSNKRAIIEKLIALYKASER